MTYRIPYLQRHKYLGINTAKDLRREVCWETAIKKARRLEMAINKATRGTNIIPCFSKIQMGSALFDQAVLYGLGTVKKRHASNLKQLDAIQIRVAKALA